jgi:hypothetical protein
MSEPELPWTRREIIDAVIAAYKAKPVDADLREVLSWKFTTWVGAFASLALGKPEGRAAPYVEDALATRISRVWTALRDGRDPSAAYDVPLEGEEPLTTEGRLSYGYRQMQAHSIDWTVTCGAVAMNSCDKQAMAELLIATIEAAIARGCRHYSEGGELLATTHAALECLQREGFVTVEEPAP